MSVRFRRGSFFKVDAAVYQSYQAETVETITETPAVTGSGNVRLTQGYFVPR